MYQRVGEEEDQGERERKERAERIRSGQCHQKYGWVTVGSQLGHSWVTVGSQLGHSWVIFFARILRAYTRKES